MSLLSEQGSPSAEGGGGVAGRHEVVPVFPLRPSGIALSQKNSYRQPDTPLDISNAISQATFTKWETDWPFFLTLGQLPPFKETSHVVDGSIHQ